MNNIVDPLTNELHSIFSNHGTHLLKNYVTLLQNGGGKNKGGKSGGRGGKGKKYRTSKKYAKHQNITHKITKTRNKQKNEKIKKLDRTQQKIKEELERFLRPIRDFVGVSPDFENNVIKPIMTAAVMTPGEIDASLLQNEEGDKFLKYLKFRQELKNSEAWLGKGMPITMIQTALNSKSKSLLIRALLFITAIILAANTAITFMPYATMAVNSVIKPIEPIEPIEPTDLTETYNHWEFLEKLRDEELSKSIAALSGRPGLLYDDRNLEFVMRAWQESPASSSSEITTPSHPGTPEGTPPRTPEDTQ
jgi:hypothetical protein